MSDNSIQNMPLGALLGKDYKFFVPDYQRGYRWRDEHAKALLDDLLEFALQDGQGGAPSVPPLPGHVKERLPEELRQPLEAFYYSLCSLSEDKKPQYCLQPLIVKKHDEEWEVVDGQQRLTTLLIILDVLKQRLSKDDAFYSIRYQTRLSHERSVCFEGGIMDTVANAIDREHMEAVRAAVKKWCNDNKPERDLETLWKLLWAEQGRTVNFIWYELGEYKEAENAFLNLNAGKIPLTPAEQVKALFLRRGFADEDELQIRALQWEQMENSFSRADFWFFLSRENDAKIPVDERVVFLLSLLRKKEIYMLLMEKGKDAYPSGNTLYDFYKEAIAKHEAKSVWHALCELFLILEDWYSQPEVYNWIGYLTHIEVETEWQGLLSARMDSQTDFSKTLRDAVAKRLPEPESLKELSYGSNNREITKVLLFLNINMLNQTQQPWRKGAGREDPACKFPFHRFAAEKWQLEHIDSQQEDFPGIVRVYLIYHYQCKLENYAKLFPENAEEARKALEVFNSKHTKEKYGKCLKAYEKVMQDEVTSILGWERLEDFWAKNKENGLTEKRFREIAQGGKDTDQERERLAGIGLSKGKDSRDGLENMALLSESINKSYGNSPFILKRSFISRELLGGAFVPVATQAVFNKSFRQMPGNHLRWDDEDGDAYLDFIIKEVDLFKKANHQKK